jgi:Leucine-rich repeat (LRR) protein
LSNNNITGEIPSELGKATGLQMIDLSSNLLKGTIPKELGQLKALYNLTLHNNHLSGVVPFEIQMLSLLCGPAPCDGGTTTLIKEAAGCLFGLN